MDKLLEWIAFMQFRFYKTEPTPEYKPSAKVHYYLAGSGERFTPKEVAAIWANKASNSLSKRWNYALADNVEYNKRHAT